MTPGKYEKENAFEYVWRDRMLGVTRSRVHCIVLRMEYRALTDVSDRNRLGALKPWNPADILSGDLYYVYHLFRAKSGTRGLCAISA